MNLYVITAAVDKLRFETVAAGVVPFLVADFVRLVLLVSIPALSLFLPALLM
jgi:TRAP-type C4-dicarboxylate transport system permease large subunit